MDVDLAAVAMLRIGATEEGTLRQHMINPDGCAGCSTARE